MNQVMKRAMRAANTAAVWLYRRSGGRIGGTAKGTHVLLLTVAGRRTGRPFTVPVSYFKHGSDYVVTGSAGGAKHDPQWMWPSTPESRVAPSATGCGPVWCWLRPRSSRSTSRNPAA